MLSLLLRNLLDNAINYNTQNTNIKIKLEKNSLSIEDDGKGVSPEVLKSIGERFIRPAGQKQIGSGLGFSIVKQIAKLHNLNISFENTSPKGFKITLFWQINQIQQKINFLLIILCFNYNNKTMTYKVKRRKK
eukprot:TRINITY_DN39966_c0_g1_i1.p2 TRINITY_DN39966_c0_g1~~TRINITY_DN39966_c0_g1_i1.p2  ORF type:complete len:143 (-),score=4.09 TRINITY_DN39966_c0_g1_i1:7-405(-)